MYESFYGFTETPFRLSVDEKFCFAHRHYEHAYGCLTGSLQKGKHKILLIGLPGSGKTFLCRDVISKLDLDRFVAINIMLSQLSAEELLRKIALELGLPAEEYNKMTLLSSIHDCMEDLRQEGKRIIVFLDEAHDLMASDFIEIRLLSSLQDLPYSALQIVLIGNPQLRESFLETGIEYVSQETISTCEINCMTVEQTEGYIKHRLDCVGWKSDPEIDGSVFLLIYDVTQGIARSINHVMSRMLLFAAFEKKHQINIDDALVVIQMLIKDDRLTLHAPETMYSLEERYKPGKSAHHASSSQRRIYGRLGDEPRPCQVDGPLFKQGLEIDDVSPKHDVTKIDTDIGQGYEDTDSSFDDWDLPDTDWLDWDDNGPAPDSIAAQSQSNHASGMAHRKESRQKKKHKGLQLKQPKDEHQWCGVWWMSDNVKGKMRSDSLIVDDLPSITIERCPELLSEKAPVGFNDQSRVEGVRSLKPTTLLVLIVCGCLLLLFSLLLFMV